MTSDLLWVTPYTHTRWKPDLHIVSYLTRRQPFGQKKAVFDCAVQRDKFRHSSIKRVSHVALWIAWHLYLSHWIGFPKEWKSISIQKPFSSLLFSACKRIHQLFCFVDGFLMLICRVKYLFVPLSPFCHSVYPVLVTHFIYLCAWLHSWAHVFFIMLFYCHPVSTRSIQRGLLEGPRGTKRVHIAALFTRASWIAWKKGGKEKSLWKEMSNNRHRRSAQC